MKKIVCLMSILLSDSDVKNALKNICGALRDLVPFVQFKKREKHPWRSANFSNVAGFSLFCSGVFLF